MPIEPKAIVVIPARWDSSRFPGKPLARIRDKPMVVWVMEQARKARSVAEVLVATDDRRIYDAVESFGGRAVMTSPDHLSGTDRVAEVAEKQICDIVVNVQGDEPLVPAEDIDLIVRALAEEPETQVSTLMIPIRDADEMWDPNIAKVVVDNRGHALYFSRAPIPYDRDAWPQGIQAVSSREVPYGFKHIGLYAYRKSFLLEFSRLQPSPGEKIEKLEQLRVLENGFCIRVMQTDKNSIGVDCEADLIEVEKALAERMQD